MNNTQNFQQGETNHLRPVSIPNNISEGTYVDVDMGPSYAEPVVSPIDVPIPEQSSNHIPIYHISVVNNVSNENEEEMFKIYRYRRSLKFFTMIDGVFLLLNSFLSAPYSLIYLIALIFVAFGYIGAKEYKPCYLIFYMVYLFCRALSEIAFMVAIPEGFILILGLLMIGIDCYILYFAYKFYMLLKMASDSSITVLENGWIPHRDGAFILY